MPAAATRIAATAPSTAAMMPGAAALRCLRPKPRNAATSAARLPTSAMAAPTTRCMTSFVIFAPLSAE